jgi:SagB-type dehydrogenase family enzyme
MDFFGGRHIVVSIIGNAGLGIKVAATQNGKCDMDQLTLEDAISKRRSDRAFDDKPLTQPLLHKLLWAAQGITNESGKRTVPSAHALHPLRLFVSAGQIEGVAAGTYQVSGDTRELTLHLSGDRRGALQQAALDDQPWIGGATAIITICADMLAASQAFAEQPPYGARGRRYAYIEAGAAAQNIYLQAAAEGLSCALIAGFRDEATADMMQLPLPLEPVIHMCIGWPAEV